MPCSHVFEFGKFIDDYVYKCATTLWLSSKHPCTTAMTPPAQGLPRARCPASDFKDFSKKFRQPCRDRSHEQVFLDGNSILREVRAMAYVGRGVAAHSKLLVPTPSRIRCEDLRAQLESTGLRPTSFQKHSGDRLDSCPKPASKNKTTPSYFSSSRGCERVVTLSILRVSSFLTLRLHGSRVKLGRLNFLRSTTRHSSHPRALESD
jgi:hypothetical protein